MKNANPYLYFDGNTLEVFTFYKSVFGGEFMAALSYKEFGGSAMGASEDELNRIAHIALPLGKENYLMGTDILKSHGQSLTVGNNFYIALEADSAEEAEKIFNALSAGGGVVLPLHKTEWAEKFGICADKFGVQWMMSYTGSVKFPS